MQQTTGHNHDQATDDTLSDELLALLVREHRQVVRPALERLWDYYRNELNFDAGDGQRPYRAAQEQGLPQRLTRAPGRTLRLAEVAPGRREVVVENDIAWRIHTLVDFMFGKGVTIQSLAEDAGKAAVIERVLNAAVDAAGGVGFYQDMALLGSVYGYVDLLLRADWQGPARRAAGGGAAADGGGGGPGAAEGRAPEVGEGEGSGVGTPSSRKVPSKPIDVERAERLASNFMIETVEAPRAIPVLDPSDYRRLVGYAIHYTQVLNAVDRGTVLSRLVDGAGRHRGRLATVDVTEVWTPAEVRVYEDAALVERRVNRLGRLPVVHIQNLPQPFYYEGLSEVEPLIPLQDELNTRLSDRANRVTLQSFKMYLGKGIEDFIERPISPGQMWMTENPDASIEAFGGDATSPSEEAHINEIREAMDKTSAVTGVTAGLLRNKVGNLTSANALRIVLMGLLAKTEKKRQAYGQGIEKLCELVLHALDVAGVLRTSAAERKVCLHWPNPLPEDEGERLRDAEVKLRLGVPREQVLRELGYACEG